MCRDNIEVLIWKVTQKKAGNALAVRGSTSKYHMRNGLMNSSIQL